ncbi:MAG: endonuclease/exonuclease/phosphatase family protein [Herminiimonas sp.]|nr:endonuclease/exonuclease/phosphatase family protein [Herminiimonas sp.]
MQQELRFATFNVLNLAPPGVRFYIDQEPYTQAQYEAKVEWIAQQLDSLDADVIGFQEIFSQAVLKDVLSRTRKYRTAHHVGMDPEARPDFETSVKAGTLTPSVALVSRLPLAGQPTNHTRLPHGLTVALPGSDAPVSSFTRPILHVQVCAGIEPAVPGRPAPRQHLIDVFVCHLKSKRPDYGGGLISSEHDSYQLGMAMLRSSIRRDTEALGLRYLVSDQLRRQRLPLVVLGDFNDVAVSTTIQIVSGAASERRSLREGPTDRLFDSYRVQSRTRVGRDVGFTHMHDGSMETIDHVLVSDAFEPGAPAAAGEVLEVIYVNDHLGLRRPEATDHGLVLARILLYGSVLGG